MSFFTHHSLVQVASQLLQNGTYLYGHVCASTHGQKSWDICRICLNSHTHQTKSRTSLTGTLPLPLFHLQYGTVHFICAFSPAEFQHCFGWERGQQQCIFQMIAVLFQKKKKNTDTCTGRCCKAGTCNPCFFIVFLFLFS